MPRPITQTVFEALHRFDVESPFVWLYEVEVPTDPATRIRIAARHPVAVFFRGNTFYPFPATHSAVTETTEGDLSTTALTISNISREIVTLLEEHNGLVGQPVKVFLVSKLDLSSGNALVEQDFRIKSVSVNAESITAQLAVYNLYKAKFPALRLMRGHCRFAYRGTGCGYALAVSDGGLATCDKTYDGDNGCVVHGDNEVANGQARKHPARFGGFLGIPRQLTAGGL